MADLPDRRSHRLAGRDYSQPGSYFITICVQGRRNLLGEVNGDRTILSPLGLLVERELLLVPRRRAPWILLGEYIVMPNHVHAILHNRRGDAAIHRKVRSEQRASDPTARLEAMSAGAIVGALKAGVTREARRHGWIGSDSIWQRDYHDHVIRNPEAARRISAYIRNNPLHWSLDPENPQRMGIDEFHDWLEQEGKKSPDAPATQQSSGPDG